jgi:hypothetical protein
LDNNNIGDEGAIGIADAVQNSQYIEQLFLIKNSK